ncbi:MAG: alpha/beta fold hydrolase [Imperialibacter sp.]|uniref:alpha/beta hydrolase n=1 Tax=Imperialibacter sp. TaxID=2038411 RepID=UPI0032EDAC29
MLKRILYTVLALIAVILAFGLVLAFIPLKPKSIHKAITPEEAAEWRQSFSEPHYEFTTTDGETLFMRRWSPDSVATTKKGIGVLILHGITAHSGAYKMAGVPLAKAGYTTFGLDYRGHGLSGGNRADYPSKERRIADLVEAVDYVKSLGYSKVVVFGHSLGVASAIMVAKAVPDEIAGLILLSGAYEGKKGVTAPPSLYEKAKILSSAFFRPSLQVVEYYREGMTGLDDPLFNFKYTLRFLSMLDVKELRLPKDLNMPVLVGVGDKDELFEVEQVKALYDEVPGDKKEFVVLKDTYHARFPDESWQELIGWLDRSF